MSKLTTGIATLGVMIGLSVMILSVCIIFGFKHEISEKVIGFGSHISILNGETVNSVEGNSIIIGEDIQKQVKNVPGVESVQRYSTKMGLIKTSTDFKGLIFKGVGEDFDSTFLQQHIIEGNIPVFSTNSHRNDIIISTKTASELGIRVGERVYTYFFENGIRMRRFNVAALYESNMDQFDDNIVISNFYTVNQLNNWDDSHCTGMEIKVKDFNQLQKIDEDIIKITAGKRDADGHLYATYTIKELYSHIFEWLKLLDLNIWVILILMICVAAFTMISGLLILILERTSTIGVLRAVGGSNGMLRKIFLHYSSFIIIRGLVWGNIIGIGIALIQKQWHILSLDASSYYVDHVPVLINWWAILGLNIATLLICLIILIIPSFMVSRINPVK
ncbi:MAG: ABC transporter permease, partial [Prevotellaceae bacterium]|nr:ABC transporter permease [Candidatus Faecinaster equi]